MNVSPDISQSTPVTAPLTKRAADTLLDIVLADRKEERKERSRPEPDQGDWVCWSTAACTNTGASGSAVENAPGREWRGAAARRLGLPSQPVPMPIPIDYSLRQTDLLETVVKVLKMPLPLSGVSPAKTMQTTAAQQQQQQQQQSPENATENRDEGPLYVVNTSSGSDSDGEL